MDLRDYFAGQAINQLTAISAKGDLDRGDAGTPAEAIARQAYTLADAMLAERAKATGQEGGAL
ncbi:hypothetical protein ABIC65_001056 [Sphingomonas trueperi]|uniref:hypothetical protein n=1 Tax=Sphingomonas trueperi TaxID=53317 RepID=UPI00339885AD